ncbi:MAG: apolipoprotein N-acyltransferase [Spirochaetia bacterium]|nr:apolipoprotein N-acyltransferase [Spirochaetia bacterium]
MNTLRRRVPTALPLLLIVVAELLIYYIGPLWAAQGAHIWAPESRGTADYLFLALLIGHGMWAYVLLTRPASQLHFDLFRLPEILLTLGLALFLFSYIFASNANLSYAQMFAETSGNLNLAPNSTIQRLTSLLRYGPLLLYDLALLIFFRIKKRDSFFHTTGTAGPAALWSLPLSLLAAILYTLSLPSFLSVEGWAPLAFVALIPLYAVLRVHSYRWALFYGVSFGILQLLLTNYWLGTFSLITLQLVSVFLTLEYILFFGMLLIVRHRVRAPHLLLYPAGFVLFDFLRSQGFLGYPWGMLGSSQYQFVPFIQVAALAGVYGVTFVVVLTNGLLFELWQRPAGRRRGPAAGLALLWLVTLGFGLIHIHSLEKAVPRETVKVALVQQNTDPRKHDYRYSFDILKRLTDRAVLQKPDLVAWSETAFVPNIRKWGAMEPDEHSLARLVHDFRDYQRSLDTWLLTGNDDYEEIRDPEGRVVQSHYNATVLFSAEGERMDTYRKLHLVPFSEYFPYQEEYPWVFTILKDFDADLWEKGEERVTFEHPRFSFFTPICFEDSFPAEVRAFVRRDADVILNLSNDYWSLTEVEGQQHFANSLFRAVENGRPLLRSTASGMTAYVSPEGRIRESLPYYQEGVIVPEVALYDRPPTPYLRWGNWFVLVTALIIGVFALRAGLRYRRTLKTGSH